MQAICEPDRSAPAWSSAKRHALFIATLLAALLGLTLLDVAPSRGAQRQHAAADDSIDCIVASAIFAGVSGGEPVRSP
jgi:hypothetical protein